jgi:hypothetical protein
VALVFWRVTVGLLPKGTVVFAVIVRVRLAPPAFPVRVIVTLLRVTLAASKEVLPPQIPSKAIVPELWVKVPPLTIKLRSTESVPEVAVKVPPDWLKVPLISIAAALPEKVPSLNVSPAVPTVRVIPEFCVIVPEYPADVVNESTERLESIVALLSQSASKVMVSEAPGTPAPPPVHEAGFDDAQFAESLVLPPLLPTHQ